MPRNTKNTVDHVVSRAPAGPDTKSAESLVQWISDGRPLTAWCREHRVGRSTVYRWVASDPEFAEQLASARQIGKQAIEDQILEIVDNEGGEHGDVYERKLKAWGRLQLLERWDPKDRQEPETKRPAIPEHERRRRINEYLETARQRQLADESESS